jgi:hypothetical protein
MASLTEAFPEPCKAAAQFERKENPQAQDELPSFVQHVKEARHVLGLVGGNEVSRIQGNSVDLESDLLGLTRPATHCPGREHLPPTNDDQIRRVNAKGEFVIHTTPVHLRAYQQWAYPSVLAPEPLVSKVCMRPEKY